jgi:hypothetical protein
MSSARPATTAVRVLFLGVWLSLFSVDAGSQAFDSGFRFNDQADQVLFVEAVRKEGIPFDVRNDGTLVYSCRDEERVSKVRALFLEENFVPSAFFPDPGVESRVTAALDSAKIPWGVRIREGRRYITWSKADAERADAVVNSVIRSPIR